MLAGENKKFLVMLVPPSLVIDLLDPVPKPTVFESIPSASDICNWNPVLELLGTVRNSVSEVF
jgi:hypothetical protein